MPRSTYNHTRTCIATLRMRVGMRPRPTSRLRPAGSNERLERIRPKPFFLRIVDSPSKEKLAERLTAFMDEWNETAHSFHWTTKSVARIMEKCQSEDSKPLATAASDFRSHFAGVGT